MVSKRSTKITEEENAEKIAAEMAEEHRSEEKALHQAVADGSLALKGYDRIEDAEADDDESEHSESSMEKPEYGNIAKALKSKIDEFNQIKQNVPWIESMDIMHPTPLPFGNAGAEGTRLDIHDDLKREVAFYNVALEGVFKARDEYKKTSVPFTRPADFFAEMVKTDDHMAKVKDRLIFEGKKIAAFELRKNNKESKLRAKETRAAKRDMKARLKKDHMKAVDDWATSAASNRPSNGMVRDDDDEKFGGPNKKRQRADNKFGFGGQTGRFKVNEKKVINDMSGYNPHHGGSGGQKMRQKNGSGANRKGKRARDASRSKSRN